LKRKSHIAQTTGETYQFSQTVTTLSLGALTKGILLYMLCFNKIKVFHLRISSQWCSWSTSILTTKFSVVVAIYLPIQEVSNKFMLAVLPGENGYFKNCKSTK